MLLIVGYYLWEMITPYNLRREIHENKNMAVAIVAGAFVIGMGIVIAAAIARSAARRRPGSARPALTPAEHGGYSQNAR